MFAKIENGVMIPAKRIEQNGDETVIFPTDEQLANMGFKPVVFSLQPLIEDGYEYAESWEEKDESIVQRWTLVPSTEEPNAEELLDILTGDAE